MKAWLEFYPGDDWSLWIAALVAQGTAVLASASVVSLGLRRHPAARHALWLAALGYLLAVPAVTELARQVLWLPVPLSLPTPVTLAPAAVESLPTRRPSNAPIPAMRGTRIAPHPEAPDRVEATAPAARAMAAETRFAAVAKGLPAVADDNWPRALFVAVSAMWAAGALLFLARLVHGLRAASRLRRNAQASRDPRVLRLADEAAQQLRLGRRPPVLLASAASGPLSVGLARPAVVLPPDLPAALDDAALAAVLRHEFAHASRRDTLVGLVEQLVRALWWPNPLVWRLCRELDRAREELCDNAALEFGEATAYAETLLAVATLGSGARPPATGLAFLGRKRSFEARIVNLLDRRRTMTTKSSLWTRIALVTVMGAVGLFAAWGTRGIASDDSAARSQKQEVAEGNSLQAVGAAQDSRKPEAAAKQGDDELAGTAEKGVDEAVHPSGLEWKNLRSYIDLVETNFNRAVAAEQQFRAVDAAYRVDTVTLDLLLDAIRRRTEALTAYYVSVRTVRRTVMDEKHREAIDHECLIQQLPPYEQGVNDSRQLLLWIVANRPTPQNVAQASQQLDLMQKQLDSHKAKIEQSHLSGKDPREHGLYVVTYNVGDLLPHPERSAIPQLQVIEDLISRTVAPDSWDKTGGPASISGYPTENSLIVAQTPVVHEQVVKLLDQIRSLKEPQEGKETDADAGREGGASNR